MKAVSQKSQSSYPGEGIAIATEALKSKVSSIREEALRIRNLPEDTGALGRLLDAMIDFRKEAPLEADVMITEVVDIFRNSPYQAQLVGMLMDQLQSERERNSPREEEEDAMSGAREGIRGVLNS